MNAMPPDPRVPWRRLARRMAGPARGDAAVAHRVAAPAARRAVLAAGLAGARLRRDRGGDPATIGGWMDCVRRRRVPDAGRLHRADADDRRQLGPRPARVGHARPEPRRAPRARPLLRPLAEGDRRTAPTASRRSSGSSASTPSPSRSRRICPAAGGPPTAYPHPAAIARDVAVRRRRRCRSSAGWSPADGGTPATGRVRRPASTATATTRRSARGPPCRGAPAGRRTASPATSARTRRSARPTRPSRSATPIEILGVPEVVLHLAVSAPVATAVVRLTDVAPDGTSAQVSAGILNLTHRRSHEHPEPLEPGRVEEVRIDAAAGRLPVRAGPPDPRVGGVVGVAGRLAVAVRGRVRAPSRPGDAVAPRPAGRPAGRRPGRRRRCPAFKTTPPDAAAGRRRGQRGRAGLADHGRRHRRHVTVTIHDGGEDVLDDGRRLYAAETLTLTASDADPARASLDADVVYRWHEHALRDRDPRALHPDQRRRRRST